MKTNNHILNLAAFFSLLLVVSSCSKDDPDAGVGLEAVNAKATVETVEDQLRSVKKSVMRFHSFEQARQAGYAEDLPFNPSPYVPHMGFHYTNVGLMDGTFEMHKPEILLYVPNAQGKLKFVAIEYAVPVALSPTPPEGFIGGDDEWHFNPNVAGGAWTLHAWIIEDNPDGVFADFNPNVPASNPAED